MDLRSRLDPLRQLSLSLLLVLLCAVGASGTEHGHIVLQLRWLPQFQFAGYYAALWNGYYEEAGLDVEIRSGIHTDGSIISATDEVSAGRAHFGIGAVDILLANENDPVFSVLATYFQKSATRFYALAEIGRLTPLRLLELKVARKVNGLADIELQAMLMAEGIDPRRVTPHLVRPGVDDLITGAIDVLPAYSIASPYAFAEAGVEVTELSPHDYGVDFYGDSLFGRTEYILENTEIAAAFVDASNRGWLYALEHPDEVATRLTEEFRDAHTVEDLYRFNRFQADGVRELTMYPTVEIGHTNPNRWKRMHEVLTRAELIDKPFDAESFVLDVQGLSERITRARLKAILYGFSGAVTLALFLLIWVRTLRKKVREATAELRDTNERFDLAVDASRQGLFDWNVVTDEIYYSPNWKRMLGYEPDELPDRFATWERLTHPDDVVEAKATIKEHFDGRLENYEQEFRMRHKDGHWVYILAKGKANFDDSGRPVRVLGTHTDVSERKKAEIALENQRLLLEKSQELGSIGTWELDLLTNTLAWTDENCRIFGVSEGSIVDYETFLEKVHPEDREFVDKEWRVATKGKPYDIEHRLLIGGQVKWVREKATVTYAEDGEALRAVGFTQDITDRKQAEEARRESEEKYRKLYENASIGIFHSTFDGRFLDVNPALAKMLGFETPQEILDSIYNIAEQIYVKPQARDEVVAQSLAKGKTVKVENLYRRKDGSEWVAYLHLRYVSDLDGQPLFLEGFVEDITDRKRLERAVLAEKERFSSVFQQAADAILLLEVQEQGPPIIADINPAGLALHGYKKNELIGRPSSILDSPEGEALIPQRLEELRRDGGTTFQTEQLTSDKRRIEVEVTAKAIKLGGKPYILSMKRDVTERNAMEARFRETQKMEALGTLAGGIAHDFNNMLGAILGYSELALHRLPPGSELAEDLTEVVHAGERARELVKQILAFSRKGEQSRLPIQAHLVVGEALRLLRQTIPSNIPIHQELDKEHDLVLGDPTQLHQIVMNLCTNAYHAMRETGGRLTVELIPIEVDAPLAATVADLKVGPHVRLTVADTGSGMDPVTAARVFEPFFTTKPQGEGTGMGLAVVHGIVRSHEGAIQVESQLGEGTRIHVYLPRHSGEPESATSAEATMPRGTERILVVDDEPALARMTGKMLGSLGYRVESVSTSEEALAMFRQTPEAFDLVLTDQTMPGMTGDVLVHKMLEIRPDLPVLICTGYSESLDEDRAQAIGAKGLLAKPLERTDLANRMREALGGDGR